jgi:hypothetical protein
MLLPPLWTLAFTIIGFIIGALAGAGLSWLYAVMTLFKQIKRIFQSIEASERKEAERLERHE